LEPHLPDSDSPIHIYVLETDALEIDALEIDALETDSLNDDTRLTQQLLDSSEQARLLRLTNGNVRSTFIASRILLREKLGKHLNRDPSSLRFATHELGKPYLEGSKIEFNISHSKKRIALAISDQLPLGVDVEFIKRKNRILKVANRYFSQPECRQLDDALNKRDMFFNFWTLKESYIKALGMGLKKGLNSFGYDIADNITIWDDEYPVDATSFFSYRLTNDYHLSLCVLQRDIAVPRLISVDSLLNETPLEPLWFLTSSQTP